MENSSFNESDWLTPSELAKKNHAKRRWPGNTQVIYPIIKKYYGKVEGVFLKVHRGFLINETAFYRLVEMSPTLTSKAKSYEGYREAYDNGKLGKRVEKSSWDVVEALGSDWVASPSVGGSNDDRKTNVADSKPAEESPTLFEQHILEKIQELDKSLVAINDKLSFWT